MVAEDKILMSMKSSKNAVPPLLTSLTEIAQMENDTVLRYGFVPSPYQLFIHILGGLERTAAETDDVLATEVSIGREPKVLGGEPKDSFLTAHG